MTGLFITFEGVEGGGKSTQIAALSHYLAAQGQEIVHTREPGGTFGAESIRDLLVNGATDQWSDLTECLLMNAARAEHLQELIRPALSAGKTVLCDRFMDSTRAYQGGAGGLSLQTILEIEKAVVADTQPDMTFILDLPIEEGLKRAATRGGEDRFERKGAAYHQRVRQGFLDIANAEPQRCHLIDATMQIEDVTKSIISALQARLDSR